MFGIPGKNQHVNLLELKVGFLVLEHNKALVQGVVCCLHQQTGRSTPLLKTVENLWLKASEHLMCLRALHIPGLQNRVTDHMSRGNPLPDEWSLHPDVVQQIWTRLGKAEVDILSLNKHKASISST